MNASHHVFLREEKEVAKYKKKRARELKHDKFRDTTMGLVDRAAHRMEGKGRKVLYAIGALIAVGLIAWAVVAWRAKSADKARLALGRAIQIAETPVVTTPVPGSTAPSFRTEKERAQKAVQEFQKVAADYGGSTGEYARYLAATNQLVLDRAKGVAELDALAKSGGQDVSTLAKFALAQAKEGDAKYDEAAALYSDLVKQGSAIITPDTANLHLALVYEKLNKKQEAADILFKMVEASRQAKGKDGKPVQQSGAVRKGAEELEKLDPARYAQLTPPPLPSNLSL
jgi:lipopolysaccharide biosynthesis regulator YciM